MRRTVQDVMTRKVIFVRDSAPFKEMVRLMNEYRVSALPVVGADGRLVGIVSEGDLLLKEEYGSGEERAGLFERKRRRVERDKAAGLVAAQVMTTPVVTVGPEATLAQAARLMHEKGVKRLPVVDAEGRVLGIVSRADLLKIFLRPDEEVRRDVEQALTVPTGWVEPSAIRVAVRGGVATLEGRVELRSIVPILVGIAQGVDGVVGVQSRLGYEVDNLTPGLEMITPWGVFTPPRPGR